MINKFHSVIRFTLLIVLSYSVIVKADPVCVFTGGDGSEYPILDVRAFTEPQDSDWGGWSRGTIGSVYAGWDVFEASPDPVYSNDSTPDGYVTYVTKQTDPNATPNYTQFGVAPSDIYQGFPEAQVIAGPGLGIFKTSTNNWYSFSGTPVYDVLILADEAHQQASGPITVAFQLATAGSQPNHSSVELVGYGNYDSKLDLHTCEYLYTYDQDGNPVYAQVREYLYLWEIPNPSATYQISFEGSGSSMSLNSLAIDVGFSAPSLNVPATPLWALTIFALMLTAIKKYRGLKLIRN